MSVLYPKMSKEFYHHIKFWESVMNSDVFYKKKSNLKNFTIFTAKHLYWGLFFNKNASLQVFSFIKKRLQHKYFLDNIAKFLRTAILKNICEWLLLRVFPFILV